MIDLKETKRVKQLLLDTPGRVSDAIESTPLAVCITNQEGKFVAVNNNYCQLYGYPASDLIGQHFSMVVPAANRSGLSAYHDRFFIDKYEIIRKWVVQDKAGRQMEIFADAGYNDKINGKPHKITLIQFLKYADEPDAVQNKSVAMQ